MEKQELAFALKQHLSVVNWASNNSELVVRCPYCGDSRKNRQHAHLYISTVEPHSFYCQKCGTAAKSLTPSHIRDFGFYDPILTTELYKSSQKHMREQKLHAEKFNTKFVIPFIDENNKHWKKIEYLEARLGESFTNSEIQKFKIILDFKEFYKLNDLSRYVVFDNKGFTKRMINDFHSNCIGFLSSDRNLISFRYIGDDTKHWRYKIFQINQTVDMMYNFYAIKNAPINLEDPRLSLNLTEGPIDIISVYKKFSINDCDGNNVYCACNGKSFRKTILYFIREGFLGMAINIWSDSDVELDFYRELKRTLPGEQNMKIIYNTKSKDFGVPLAEINIIQRIQ